MAFPLSKRSFIFTSESVSEGHPDKMCDIISDALVDAYLAKDPQAKLAIETLVTKELVVLAGEIRTDAHLTKTERADIARQCIRKIGYDQEGFHWGKIEIKDVLHTQSPDIARGIELSESSNFEGSGNIGAGDQGMMIGYATDETPGYLPAPLYYSHRILEALATDRKSGMLPTLGPDAKVQLSCTYQEGMPTGVATIVLSHQHKENLTQTDVRHTVMPYIKAILPKGWMCDDDQIFINPTGRFVIGGPVGDTGLTGRKIIVDTYGSAAAHGGGAFSGKDPTKVDRSGAYMARYLAKNIVAANLSKKCTLQISYGIGLSEPLSLFIDLHGTGVVSESGIESYIRKNIDLSPRGIIDHLNLSRPIYQKTASYGHFGRDKKLDLPWEKADLKKSLQNYFKESERAVS